MFKKVADIYSTMMMMMIMIIMIKIKKGEMDGKAILTKEGEQNESAEQSIAEGSREE